MNKKGFLLLECISALGILMWLASLYAWYFWQSLALQKEGVRLLERTITMSNVTEQVLAHAPRSPALSSSETITYHLVQELPEMEGLWASIKVTTPYDLYALSMAHGTPNKKEESLIWYVGDIRINRL